MAKTGKSEENFKDKIKNLFRRKNENVTFTKGPVKDVTPIFTSEILKDIGPESPGNNRIKTIKELSEVVLKKKLEETGIEAVWCSIQDLVLPQTVSEKRHVALHFLQCILEGQYNNLGVLRGHFFNVIQTLTLLENIGEKLSLLKTLSENGKCLLEFEEEAGPFFLNWFPDVIVAGKVSEFLPLLISVIKFNAAYMDENIISGLVRQTCSICNRKKSTGDEIIKLCLDVLDTVLCYSFLPSDTLHDVVAALCRMVNIAVFCEQSWELMRKLLGTHLGHSSIYTMCTMLQTRQEPIDYNLLRGAIFYIGMALWGSRKVPFLKHTPAAVLPSFLHVLSLGNPMIGYEVTLSVQRLVKKYGKELPHSTWDIILDILETVLRQLESAQDLSADPRNPADLHDTLTTIEQLHEHGQFSGSVEHFFRIIELCASKRPETSVILLISHLAQDIHPGREHWMLLLHHLLDRYLRNENRSKIRLKALDVLTFILSINKHMYEEDLINNIVLPQLCHIETDSDVNVRKFSVEILVNLAQGASPQSFMDLIAVIDKIISQPLVGRQLSAFSNTESCEVILDESHLLDVKRAVVLMVDLFKMKLYAYPPGVCIKLYEMLIAHLSRHFAEPQNYTSHTAAAVRKSIIECLLNLRADVYHRLGFFDRSSDNPLKYSPYVTCNSSDVRSPPRSPVTVTTPSSTVCQWAQVSYLEYTKSFCVFIQCLEIEKDWDVLKCVLENLPILLQNKTIILSAKRNLVDNLCSRLCAMVNARQLGYPEKLVGAPEDFTRSDFHAAVFPVLAAMSTYHNYLDRNKQRELVKCLEFGMVSKCAKLCVNALRLCTLEIQEVMMRSLPSVLLQLSKISATISMAIPVLAFLSSIVRIPKMYANFVEDEYMSVFAIALPYTNPFKFSHYTVSLAHHVIAIWFIRCRLPFRKGFVQFIQKGLKANVLQQFEENARLALQSQNQDSSDRVRSGSYSEAALRSRRRMQSGSAVARSEVSAPVDEKLSQFHRELTETCTDIMSKYAFGNFSALPHRSHMAEFLLNGGQSQSWLLGNKLITVTTSGSGTKAANSGVCEKCLAAYQSAEREQRGVTRRRHRSAVVFSRSSSTITEPGKRSSQDDMTVKSRTSLDDMTLDLDMTGQDVGVQTGSSLSESAGVENEPLESLILGMKGTEPMKLNVCNCWSTNWAEIFIRAPSGNVSWMMRIENEAGLYSVQDSQIPDITMLFASMGKKRPPVTRHSHRIESGSIGEEEYETLYKQHFENMKLDTKTTNEREELLPNISEHETNVGDRPGSLGFTITAASLDAPSSSSNTSSETHQISQALQIPYADTGSHDLSPGSLKRSNSSPSVLSGSLDTLSPRDNISDIVQFGPPPGLAPPTKPKSQTKVLDSPVRTSPLVGGEVKTVTVETETCDITKSVDLTDKATELPQSSSQKTDGVPIPALKSAVGHVKFEKVQSMPKEYTSMLTKQLSPSPDSSETSSIHDEVGELPVHLRRQRGHTIAVDQPSGLLSGVQRPDVGSSSSGGKDSKVGVSPSFVFLQLYHSGQLQVNEVPLLLPNNETTERAIKMLDHIYPYETHKIGILYVGRNQVKDEKAVLSNECGSDRYMRFVHSLGTLVRLKDCNRQKVYLGGLDTNGNDGQFTYTWQDESTQLIFHIATLMPNKESDPNCNSKKLHIGNDYVTVVYNDSDEECKIGVIKGQFNYVNIVIKPLDYESNAVTLQAKEVPFQDQITTDIAGILGHTDTKIISDTNLAALVRHIAIHCNLASMVLQRQASQPQDPFANNWLERLRKIRRMRTLISQSQPSPESPNRTMEDFTQYV